MRWRLGRGLATLPVLVAIAADPASPKAPVLPAGLARSATPATPARPTAPATPGSWRASSANALQDWELRAESPEHTAEIVGEIKVLLTGYLGWHLGESAD